MVFLTIGLTFGTPATTTSTPKLPTTSAAVTTASTGFSLGGAPATAASV